LISVDGTARTHRDTLEAANVLKALNLYSKVLIQGRQTRDKVDLQKA